MKQSYVLQAFVQMPWAILPSKLAVLEEIVMRHLSGESLSADEIQARINNGAQRPQEQKVNSVAVLPLFGTIIPRADMYSDISGGTSAERFGNQFMELVKDPSISAIVIDVDSPGGAVYGVAEVAQKIFNARGTKPIIAIANHQMASAAYWIGSAADELVVTPSGDVGSIGVFAAHRDISSKLEKDGVKMTLISAGKYKVEGNPFEPIGEDARATIQANVNEVYDEFVNAVALHRGVKSAIVKDSFGEGRMVSARQAVELGMADRVATLDETVERLFQTLPSAQGPSIPARAETDRKAQSLRERVNLILNKE